MIWTKPNRYWSISLREKKKCQDQKLRKQQKWKRVKQYVLWTAWLKRKSWKKQVQAGESDIPWNSRKQYKENSIRKSLWSIWLGQGLFTYIGVKYNILVLPLPFLPVKIRCREVVSDKLIVISFKWRTFFISSFVTNNFSIFLFLLEHYRLTWVHYNK